MAAFLSRSSHASSLETTSICGTEVVLVHLGGRGRTRTLGARDSRLLAEGCRLAAAGDRPLVIVMSVAGLHVADGWFALQRWGECARSLVEISGRVPILVGVPAQVISEVSLLASLADMVVMGAGGRWRMSSVRDIADTTGVDVALVRPSCDARRCEQYGLTHLVVGSRGEMFAALGRLAALLSGRQDNSGEAEAASLPRFGLDPPERECCGLRTVLPDDPAKPYDVRTVIAEIVDRGTFLEISASWAANIVTGFAELAGRPVGIVANQPSVLAGTIDVEASRKAAQFVSLCDRHDIGILTLVDTPGFMPGKNQEWEGMIRHGAKLAFAYARATVARVCVLLRKAYGGAWIVMDSKPMGSDVCYAWPTAEIAVMGPEGAARIVAKGAAPHEIRELRATYRKVHLNPWRAAERCLVDDVIDPSETRRKVTTAFETLSLKSSPGSRRRHDNIPL